ncbi:MAG: YgjV family protein [Ruminococcaceae bacterium]|nr:YgjV family protein [Oscillospiraceae bacterium]
MTLVTYLFGAGALVSLFMLYQQKTRRGMLLAKLSADVLWSAHYLCLGAFAGMIPNAVGIFRECIFVKRKTNRWAAHAIWPVLFILLNWGLGLRTFSSWYDLLPITASSFVTLSLWIDRPQLTKLISIPVSCAFLIYDLVIGSYIGALNEGLAILSIALFFIRSKKEKRMFREDIKTDKPEQITSNAPITDYAAHLSYEGNAKAHRRGDAFAKDIAEHILSDFEREGDKMAHVSTFTVMGGCVYMSYYANKKEPSENPKDQTARLCYAPLDDLESKTFFDLQTAGDTLGGKIVDRVYDTILMPWDERTLYVLWTARVEENYYRFYCPFDTHTKSLGKIGINRFKVGNVVNDFSATGIRSALTAGGIPYKSMYADIGIMQKLSYRLENGVRYYYSGAYSGDFTCLIKSRDLITWEYVSAPDFPNDSKWENAVYVWDDVCYYFVRQHSENATGFLTAYHLDSGTWEKPVLIDDCQSRSDFIRYGDELYLFHAPIDREHIGVVRINRQRLADSELVLCADMHASCFYPFVQYYRDGELAMSYTVNREHIRLASFTFKKYL